MCRCGRKQCKREGYIIKSDNSTGRCGKIVSGGGWRLCALVEEAYANCVG